MIKKNAILRMILVLALCTVFTSVSFAAVLPKQPSPPSSTIYYIDMEEKSLFDLFMIESLQGIANRGTPSIWVLKNPIVEYDTDQPPFLPGEQMVSRNYWLNKITGYSKFQYTDQYQMVKDFANKVDGCIIYDSNLFDGYTSGARYPQPSADSVAKLNATAMLCAKYNAIALTVEQRNTLINSYGITLPILASTSTSTFATWNSTYNYLLSNFSSDFRTDTMACNSHFALAPFDYYIQNKLFIMDMKGSAAGQNKVLQDSIFDRCPANTPVLGIWNVTGGTPNEDEFQSYLNAQGKYAYVTHESFNLSWTSALPNYQPQSSETNRGLALDDNKVYISFTETDGDSFLFTNLKFPTWYDMDYRDNYPIGWELPSIISELDPLAANYFYSNRGMNCFVNPVTGVGYNKYLLPNQYRDAYNTLTSTYLNLAKYRSIRAMNYDKFDGVELTKISGIQGAFCGYGGFDAARPTVANNKETNFIYLGKPIFINYSYNKYVNLDDIKNYNGPRPAFFSVAAQYANIDTLINEINSLPSYFQVVSPNELIDIYNQYANDYTTNVSGAEFDAKFSHDESMFLQNDNGSWICDNDSRVADGTQSFTYKFDLADNISTATVSLDIANNYLVEVSKDNNTWYKAAQAPEDCHDLSNRNTINISMNYILSNNSSKVFYLRLKDASNADGWGTRLYHLKLSTNAPQYLAAGTLIRNGEYIVSPSSNCFAILQPDGNFCLYKGSGPSDNKSLLWQSDVYGSTGNYFAIMQGDGNFVIYKGTGPNDNQGFLWNTSTAGNELSYMAPQDTLELTLNLGKNPSYYSGQTWARP